MDVELIAIDETVLSELVTAAVADASADDVTPSLTTDGSWSDERITWLRAYHRERRAGLDGPAGEATWAVRAGGTVVGAGRLIRTGGGALELGIWLTRSVRGSGVGTAVAADLIERARGAGAGTLAAETTAGNAAALQVLRRLGFTEGEPGPDGAVHAELAL